MTIVFSDLTPIEEEVHLAGKVYILREADGEAACKFNNARLRRVKFGGEGKPQGLDGMADIEPLLVSLCLWDPESSSRVKESVIRSWPYRVQKALYERAKIISRLDDTETPEDLEKNIQEMQVRLQEMREGKNSGEPTEGGSD